MTTDLILDLKPKHGRQRYPEIWMVEVSCILTFSMDHLTSNCFESKFICCDDKVKVAAPPAFTVLEEQKMERSVDRSTGGLEARDEEEIGKA